MAEQFVLATARERIEQTLDRLLPTRSDIADELVAALRYASLGGGKRLRPALVCATAVTVGGDLEAALEPAAAVEFMHAYSLVHDDLPAMDDDDLRRGRPTCHIAFDEATAILAGDALQALAFATLAEAEGLTDAARVRMTRVLADAAGWRGMVGGQAFDLAATGAPPLPIERLRALHAAKTGALFGAAVQIGALAGDGATHARVFDALGAFGAAIGHAFQVVDDILDVTQPTAVLGKDAGSDVAAGKNTYPALIGLNASRALAEDGLARALAILEDLGFAGGPLAELAKATVNRIR